jgi:hypothetical protein
MKHNLITAENFQPKSWSGDRKTSSTGKITLNLDKKKITINKGDLLAISELSIISIDIQAFGNSELIFSEVN